MRMRTRSPSRTTKGVLAGPAFPLITSQLNSMVHAVRDGVVGQNSVLLEQDCEILIHPRRIARLWMHDEGAQHAHHFLHGHVRVVEIRSDLVKSEFVDEPAPWRNRILADSWTSIHVVRDLQAMPVHRGRLGQMIVQNDAHTTPLRDLNRGARRPSVKS